MAKFDKLVKKFERIDSSDQEKLSKAITDLEEILNALSEGISHYSNNEMLQNVLEPWYANAREHYERKHDLVDALIKKLKEKQNVIKAN